MNNAASGIDVTLSTFGGMFTDMSPADLPDGGSPASQDVAFIPGSVFTRPAFKRLYIAGAFLADVVWQDNYVLNSGLKLNIFLTADGNLWKEDAVNAPGTFVPIGTVPAGSRCKAIKAFGRIYLTFSDGVHGTDHAYQFDGTNFDRVSQDGPATAPTVVSLAFPSTNIAPSAALSVPVVSAQAESPYVIGGVTYYGCLLVTLNAASSDFYAGQSITIAGNSVAAFNVTGTILGPALDWGNGTWGSFYLTFYAPTSGTGNGGTISVPGNTLVRSSNIVTATTSTPHGLSVGYQAQITGTAAMQVGGGGIVSIVIDNENQPGVATVTMGNAHGLLPGNQVNIAGVIGSAVGGGVASVVRAAQVTTVTTAAAHGLSAGCEILIAGSNSTINGQWVIVAVPSATTFTFTQVDNDATFGSGGTVTTVWPIANSDPAQNFYTVQTVPTATTFTMALSYPDGRWIGGNVTFGWDGIYYVSSIVSLNSFTYQQYGPNASTNAVGGTVTPYGQAEPGIRQAVCLFQTRNGFVTAPGPLSVRFISNGGQYLSVSNIPIGPPNVTKRIIAFTGANGSKYFYLGVAPSVGAQVVGTSTVIQDNTSTTALFDFSDKSLLSGTAIGIDGNNAFAQVTLGPVCGVEYYADRLLFYGEDNRVTSLLNMGFEGGAVPTGQPGGWTWGGSGIPSLQNAANGGQYLRVQLTNSGVPFTFSQSAYQTALGANILDPTQAYQFKAKVKVIGSTDATLSVKATLSSVINGGVFATATLPISQSASDWQYFDAAFVGAMPSTIPLDALLTVSVSGSAVNGNFVCLDEMAMIFAKSPYNENTFRVSYVINPEAFDGESGIMGPSADPSKIQSTFVIRGTLHINTRDRLHAVKDLDGMEPGAWDVAEVSSDCGAVSLFGLLIGENWGAWASDGGVRIYGGGDASKISQDIQSIWDTIDANELTSIVGINDQVNRRMYFGVPTDTASAGSSGSATTNTPLYEQSNPGSNSVNIPLGISFSAGGSSTVTGPSNGSVSGVPTSAASAYWANPSNVYATDGNGYTSLSYATASSGGQVLMVNGMPSVPNGATVTGIAVSFYAVCGSTQPVNVAVMFADANMEHVTLPTSTAAHYTLGGSSDLWGLGSITPYTLASFGFSFFASTAVGSSLVSINQAVVTVYYTTGDALTLNVQTPTPGASTIEIQASATATAATVTSIQVYLDGVLAYTSPGAGAIDHTLTGVSPAVSHAVMVKAADTSGLSTSYTVNVSLPGTEVLALVVAAPIITPNSIEVQASATSALFTVASMQLSLDGTVVFSNAGSGAIDHVITGVAPGPHTLLTKVTNSYGSSTSVTSNVVVPGMDVLTLEVQTPIITATTVEIKASATGAVSPVTDVLLYLDGNPAPVYSTGGAASLDYTLTGLAPGPHTIVTKAGTSGGSIAQVTSTVVLGSSTARTIVLDYRHMESASDIADRAPVRTTLSGNIIAPDLCRKWTVWSGPSLAMGYVFRGQNTTLAFSGKGNSQVYYLDPAFMTDDDYGQIMAFTFTNFIAPDDSEQGLQLGHHRHLYAFLSATIQGTGFLKITPLADSLSNPWPPLMPYTLVAQPIHDVERGMQVAAGKMALRIEATPIVLSTDPNYTNGTDTHFDLSRLVVTMRPHPMSPTRGAI